jgi:hypothetical protein
MGSGLLYGSCYRAGLMVPNIRGQRDGTSPGMKEDGGVETIFPPFGSHYASPSFRYEDRAIPSGSCDRYIRERIPVKGGKSFACVRRTISLIFAGFVNQSSRESARQTF